MTISHETDYTEEAFEHLRALAEAGAYESISAAASAIVMRDRDYRESERHSLETEVLRRLSLPADRWLPVSPESFLDEAVARLDARIGGSDG